MHRQLAALLLVLLSLFALPAAAQESAQWYEVEVIVFRQWESGGADAERPRADVPPLGAENVVSLRGPEPGQPLTPYARLSPNEMRLHGVKQVLEKHRGYEPLLHVGWRQPGLGQAGAPAVALPAGWLPGAGEEPMLRGLIKVYRERYLHADVDLRYGHNEGLAQLQGPEGKMASTGTMADVHRQSRRMRSGELHYLDHPKLGVLIQVTPVGAAGG